MGSFDGAEACELMGLLILHELSDICDIDDNRLYRNNGLIFIENTTGRNVDNIRKKLSRLFNELCFNINADTGLKTVEYLNVKLNLNNCTVESCRKNIVL